MAVPWPTALWYRLLIGLARRLRHFRAGVRLRDHHRAVNLHYHCLGGDSDRSVAADAGTGGMPGVFRADDQPAWLDRDQMHLPSRINRFPTRALNRELYFWLAAYFAVDHELDGEDALPQELRHLFRGVATSARVLDRFPALAPRYRRLCDVELAQRRGALPSLGDNPLNRVHQLEAAVRYALGAAEPPDEPWLLDATHQALGGTCPTLPPHWRRMRVPVLPVPLWGNPPGEVAGLRLRWLKRRRRRRAYGFRKSLARPRFDPGLPAHPPTDVESRGEHVYPEWDHRRRAYRSNWCLVTEETPAASRARAPRSGCRQSGPPRAPSVRDVAGGPQMGSRPGKWGRRGR